MSKNEIIVPDHWDFFLFNKVLGRPKFDWIQFVEPHKPLKESNIGIPVYVILVKRDWTDKIKDHIFFDANIIDCIEYAKQMLYCGYIGMIGKKSINGTMTPFYNDIYKNLIGENNGITNDKGSVSRLIEKCNNYYQFYKGKWGRKEDGSHPSN